MLEVASYTTAVLLLQRLIGAVYFFAFGAFLFQIKGLLGENGILPARSYLDAVRSARPKSYYKLVPTLFWLSASDGALLAVAVFGTFCALLLMCGIYPCSMLFVLWVLYLSVFSVGQDFLSFGWELFLQEVALHTFFLSLTTVPNIMIWVSSTLLLFRFHFQAGIVKLQSRDPNWRNLTAIFYHYQSQPLPNSIAWYVHKFPMWFHKVSCLIMFVVELAVPFLLFFSENARLVAFGALFGLQFFIWLTGNFSYLNYLTVSLCVLLLNNDFFNFFGFGSVAVTETSLPVDLLLTIIGALLASLQVLRFWDHFFPNHKIRSLLKCVAPYLIANRYGIFAVMTTKRYEVIVEATEDGVHWKEYLFAFKPSEISRRPRRIAPYQPRLDWQAWFLPFQNFESEEWFQNFLIQLLKNRQEVVALMRHVPFLEAPPKKIRAMMYLYEFTTREEKRKTGNWWKRTFVGRYSPEIYLKTTK